MTDREHVYLELPIQHMQLQTDRTSHIRTFDTSIKICKDNKFLLVLWAVVVVLIITVTVFICMYVKTKEGCAGTADAVSLGNKIGAADTFVRWGRNSCLGTESSTIYYGYMAGANHLDGVGSGSNFLCLPHDPQLKLFPWYWNVTTHASQIQGVEYELIIEMDNSKVPDHPDDKNVPCSVCLTKQRTTLMIPGRTTCYPGWSVEYDGYLMSSPSPPHKGRTTTQYVCVDGQLESYGSANNNHGLITYVEVTCGSIPCTFNTYSEGTKLGCVVCSI